MEFNFVPLLVTLQLMVIQNECDKQTILQETHFKDTKHLKFIQLFIILSILVHFVATYV